jgi:lipopolysaccharide assembly outer membrane protein LptD (OstA)
MEEEISQMPEYDLKHGPKGLAKWVLAGTLLLLAIVTTVPGYSQDGRRGRRNRKEQMTFSQAVAYNPDSIPPLSDSAKAVRDSLRVVDSLFKIDSAAMQKQSSLKRPAFTGAKDSVVEVFSNGQRKIFYYGDVTAKYDDMELSADYMEYDMKTGTVYARGTVDTLTGEVTGRPKMTQGGSTYEMDELRYNFNTRKARITNMITQQEDGLLHGHNIKMMPDKSINITNGQYTVCDLEHPHYYLQLSAAKVITEPSRKIVFGPAWPVIEDVPLPVALPFGFVPKRPSRATGLLVPTVGEESARGFYFRDLGMYFVFGDHVDLSVTTDYYTLGSWAIDINSRYKFNYKSSGNFSLTYSVDQTGEKNSPDFFQTKNFAVSWSHQQDSKAHPGTTFSASVNFSSPSNNTYNSTSVSQALENQSSSSISWSHSWNGKMSLSINALHSQNSRDSSYAFTLPNLTFTVSRFYPFKKKNRVGKEKFYEKFSFGYSTTLQNKINFKSDEFMDDGFMDKFKNGMTHNFQIGLPDFTLFNYINVTPSISYGQNWFFRKTEYEFDETTNSLKAVDSGSMGAFGITQTYSGSISASTRIYGLFNFGAAHKIQAIRHVISPSLSFSYSPEKGTYANGWRTLTYTDTTGTVQTYDYNIWAGQLYSPPSKGKSATMSISFGNNLEAKVRDLRDTTGKGVKKIKLIDQLNISTGYNFLADSLRMRNVTMNMSTNVFGKVGISASANFDPYAIDYRGRRYNKLNIVKEGIGKPLRLTSASASVSYSLSGKGSIDGNDGTKTPGQSGGGSESPADYYQRIYYHPVTGEYIPGGWLYYTNPNVPWSVNINYSLSYSKSYQYTNNELITNNNYTQTLGLSGNIKLSPKMSVSFTTGYDLMAGKLTTTQLSGSYDLHCFNISVSWVPTGTWQSWGFRIAANASALSDLLKFKKNASYWDKMGK